MKKLKYTLFTLTFLLFIACNNGTSKETTPTEEKKSDAPNSSISEKAFGNIGPTIITKYTLTNGSGMQVGILNYGGTITDIVVPDRNGSKGNVVLSFDSLQGYLQKTNPYFGSLIGRYGNRIAKGKFTLNNINYKLASNDFGNSLHGGIRGYDKVIWNVEKIAGDSSLRLTYLSKDGEEGYPGNLNIEVVYTLTSTNELMIKYSATTDKATPINLTNHSYFNLSAGKDSTVLGHELIIKADAYTEVDDLLIPTGKLTSVSGGPMDFNSSKLIGKEIAAVKGGYDHNWALKREGTQLEKVASLYLASSGRQMEVYTTEPGLQFYSGNFLDGTLKYTAGGGKLVKHAGLCLETQHFPDSPNQPAFPSTILQPGEKYSHTTAYKFSTR